MALAPLIVHDQPADVKHRAVGTPYFDVRNNISWANIDDAAVGWRQPASRASQGIDHALGGQSSKSPGEEHDVG